MRNGLETDLSSLQSVDLKASALFEPTGLIDSGPDGPEAIPGSELERGLLQDLLFVVTDPFHEPVGFAVCREVRPDLYLEQISVDPSHGKRGLGAALVERVIDEARDRRLNGVILSTFRDLAWNGPFYAKHGFVEVPARSKKPWMRRLEKIQSETMDVNLRCFMRRPVRKTVTETVMNRLR